MKFVTVIPARGGSKRFPRKNVYEFMGKPLIVRSINYSLACCYVTGTYVSTDDDEIKAVSIQMGAEIIDRPDELAGDHTTSASVMQHAAQYLINNGIEFDYIVLLQATNPLRPKDLLNEAIKKIEETKVASLMTVNRSELKLGKIINNHYQPWNYHYGQRSQDLEPLYYENGLLYISSKELLLKGKIMDENMYPMVVDHIFGEVDIDTKEDMSYAEFIYNNYKNE